MSKMIHLYFDMVKNHHTMGLRKTCSTKPNHTGTELTGKKQKTKTDNLSFDTCPICEEKTLRHFANIAFCITNELCKNQDRSRKSSSLIFQTLAATILFLLLHSRDVVDGTSTLKTSQSSFIRLNETEKLRTTSSRQILTLSQRLDKNRSSLYSRRHRQNGQSLSTTSKQKGVIRKPKTSQNTVGSSFLSRLNQGYCRFTSNETLNVPCGLGVMMRLGDPISPSCIDRCVFFPLFQPHEYVCGSCQNEQFSITLDYVNVPTNDISDVFQEAANRWNAVVPRDLPDVTVASVPNLSPPYEGCSYPKILDDLYICARYVAIDGPGKILGSASPTYVRGSGSIGKNLPIAGQMLFDADDMDFMRSSNILKAVILHEMGHILGIGTIWRNVGLIDNFVTCPYKGKYANQEYNRLTGCSRIPTETDGGGGTVCKHFDEFCLKDELMTGFINSDRTKFNPLSSLTIASMLDLGYPEVDYTQADAYRVSDINPQCLCNRRTRQLRGGSSQDTTNHADEHQEFLFDIVVDDEVDFIRNATGRSNWKGYSSSGSVSNHHHRSRKLLSEEGRLMAVNYGKKLLQESQQKLDIVSANKPGDGATKSRRSPIRYVGSDVISILIEENGEIFGVMVHGSD